MSRKVVILFQVFPSLLIGWFTNRTLMLNYPTVRSAFIKARVDEGHDDEGRGREPAANLPCEMV